MSLGRSFLMLFGWNAMYRTALWYFGLYPYVNTTLSLTQRSLFVANDDEYRDSQLKVSDCWTLSPKQGSHNHLPGRPRKYNEKGVKKKWKTRSYGEGLWNALLWAWHGHWNQHLTAAVLTSTWSVECWNHHQENLNQGREGLAGPYPSLLNC